jgi:hypothetical protein
MTQMTESNKNALNILDKRMCKATLLLLPIHSPSLRESHARTSNCGLSTGTWVISEFDPLQLPFPDMVAYTRVRAMICERCKYRNYCGLLICSPLARIARPPRANPYISYGWPFLLACCLRRLARLARPKCCPDSHSTSAFLSTCLAIVCTSATFTATAFRSPSPPCHFLCTSHIPSPAFLPHL